MEMRVGVVEDEAVREVVNAPAAEEMRAGVVEDETAMGVVSIVTATAAEEMSEIELEMDEVEISEATGITETVERIVVAEADGVTRTSVDEAIDSDENEETIAAWLETITEGVASTDEVATPAALETVTAEEDEATTAVLDEATLELELLTAKLDPELAQAKLIFVTGVPESFGALKSQVMST